MTNMIDVNNLRRALREQAAALSAMKRQIRAPGHLGTWREYADLRAGKARATTLCAIRAGARGRVHRSLWTEADQLAFIGDAWREFVRSVEASAA